MKKLIKAAIIVMLAMLLASCTEADKVNSNLSKQA